MWQATAKTAEPISTHNGSYNTDSCFLWESIMNRNI